MDQNKATAHKTLGDALELLDQVTAGRLPGGADGSIQSRARNHARIGSRYLRLVRAALDTGSVPLGPSPTKKTTPTVHPVAQGGSALSQELKGKDKQPQEKFD